VFPLKRVVRLSLAIAVTPLLSACVAGMAASAISMAAKSGQRAPLSNQELQPQAREACTARAAQYGTAHVIDVVQDKVDRIIVWGTVESGTQRQSFQCNFGTQITAFALRPITPQR
jgi:hypothetical protein